MSTQVLLPSTAAEVVAATVAAAISANASCRTIAALTAAAIRALQTPESLEVASRLQAIKLAITAHVASAQLTGTNPRSSSELITHSQHRKANVAKHNFVLDTLFHQLDDKAMKKIQRGSGRGPPRLPGHTEASDPAEESVAKEEGKKKVKKEAVAIQKGKKEVKKDTVHQNAGSKEVTEPLAEAPPAPPVPPYVAVVRDESLTPATAGMPPVHLFARSAAAFAECTRLREAQP